MTAPCDRCRPLPRDRYETPVERYLCAKCVLDDAAWERDRRTPGDTYPTDRFMKAHGMCNAHRDCASQSDELHDSCCYMIGCTACRWWTDGDGERPW